MASKKQVITDAGGRNIRRYHDKIEETQAQTIAWFALVEASHLAFVKMFATGEFHVVNMAAWLHFERWVLTREVKDEV